MLARLFGSSHKAAVYPADHKPNAPVSNGKKKGIESRFAVKTSQARMVNVKPKQDKSPSSPLSTSSGSSASLDSTSLASPSIARYSQAVLGSSRESIDSFDPDNQLVLGNEERILLSDRKQLITAIALLINLYGYKNAESNPTYPGVLFKGENQTIDDFLHRLAIAFPNISNQAWVGMVILMQRYAANKNESNINILKRNLLVSLMVASKMLDDDHYHNISFINLIPTTKEELDLVGNELANSKLKRLNSFERDFLKEIKYNVAIDPEQVKELLTQMVSLENRYHVERVEKEVTKNIAGDVDYYDINKLDTLRIRNLS